MSRSADNGPVSRGRSQDQIAVAAEDSTLFVLSITLLAVISAVSWAWREINNYSYLDAPYAFVALYYFYIIVMPIRFGGTIFSVLHSPGLTQYANLNLVIAIGTVVVYGGAIFAILFLFLGRSVARRWVAVALLLGPATFALVYFVGDAALHWLLAPSPA